MRALGAALILCAAGAGYVLRRREQLLPLRLGRALLADLSALEWGVCARRAPLPALLVDLEGLGAKWLWAPLAAALEGEEESLSACWTRLTGRLPPPLDRYLSPIGELLGAGGTRLSETIGEARGALGDFLREEKDRQIHQGRLTAAVCLSGAGLLILVLL